LLAQSLRRAARFVPRIADLQLVRSWAGLRPYTRDKLPIIGADPRLPGFYMAGGHEGLGITLSLATGELLAQLLTGVETTLDPAPFSPQRFDEVVHG
jgi:glycine/D-amino acid oxidase-like deaminating enzyme